MSEVLVRRRIEVLLVEDDPADVFMTREVFADHLSDDRLNVVTNGEDAVSYLRKRGRFADAVTPDLVLLDLNLPRLSGREVLRDIKADPGLRQIPIVVLTTSSAPEDIRTSYDLRANAYVCKPVGYDRFSVVVQRIDEFFTRVACPPPK